MVFGCDMLLPLENCQREQFPLVVFEFHGKPYV